MDYLTNLTLTDVVIDASCMVMLVFLTRLGLRDRSEHRERINSLEQKLDAHFEWKERNGQ